MDTDFILTSPTTILVLIWFQFALCALAAFVSLAFRDIRSLLVQVVLALILLWLQWQVRHYWNDRPMLVWILFVAIAWRSLRSFEQFGRDNLGDSSPPREGRYS